MEDLVAQLIGLLPALVGLGLLLVAMLVVLYFFRSLLKTTKACLVLAFLGVLVVLIACAALVASAIVF